MADLQTIGEVSAALGEPIHRLRYIMQSRRIKPSGRVGRYFVFDRATVERLRSELRRMSGGASR